MLSFNFLFYSQIFLLNDPHASDNILKKKLKILENPKNGLASRVIWRL